MKVQPINNYYFTKNNRQTNYANKNVSFGHGGLWNQFKLGILKKSEPELKELAKYFYKSSDEELKNVATIRNFFGFKKEEKSKKAYGILQKAVNEINESKKSMELMKQFLYRQQEKNGKLIDIERSSLETVENNLKELDEKFKSRKEKFYIEDYSLSQSDIVYFNSHYNNY